MFDTLEARDAFDEGLIAAMKMKNNESRSDYRMFIKNYCIILYVM